MRPLGITLEGFSAYRAKQRLSLEDVEFFSLSGPTGSGKSSLIDAMIFALYGRVPRLGGRAVAPVITAGTDRARVKFEFEVRGNAYVVSRVAERNDSGASVREARLETADGKTIANGAGEVTREVEDLLRLRFEDFTKTVVLPQGEFARFLNAGSTERRDLLRDLLGLDVYTRVRELANERKAEAAGRAGSARSQLESLEVPGPNDLEGARERLDSLEQLSSAIGRQLEGLSAAEDGLKESEKEMSDLAETLERLGDISPPAHLEEMDDRLVSAREAESLAEEALQAKESGAESLKARIEELPSKETIANIKGAYEEMVRLDERKAELDNAAAEKRFESAEADFEEAETELAKARQAVDAARVDHAAHTVTTTLVVGELCPVCAQEVASIPKTAPPPELTEVEQAVANAAEVVAARRDDLNVARAGMTEIETRASELAKQRDALAARLSDAPSLDELVSTEEQLEQLDAELRQARSEIEDLTMALKGARRAHEDAAEAVRSVGRDLRDAHVVVARSQLGLEPPDSESDDPIVQWKEFLSWRDATVEDLSARSTSVADDVKARRESLAGMRQELVESLASVDVPAEKPYDVTVARAVEVARNEVTRMAETIERSEDLEKQLEIASRDEGVAGALANHLRANGFERWLMAGAINGLVGGANELLAQLSGGGYSLEADEDGAFRITDHRNADEVRDVNTLSGGETFLVSLALSLSLAETLSASGGAGLDAIILDEGFGTLDDESLDVVAAVLEELAGRGLMVGVITHVKELAERAPVRYRVMRDPDGAKVEVVS